MTTRHGKKAFATLALSLELIGKNFGEVDVLVVLNRNERHLQSGFRLWKDHVGALRFWRLRYGDRTRRI